jgi:DNA-binding NarL/FixJ family response regulator
MPGANGIDVYKVIRMGRPEIQVLILSGNLHNDARRELQGLGLNNFVQKPYALDEVGRRLRSLLDNRS